MGLLLVWLQLHKNEVRLFLAALARLETRGGPAARAARRHVSSSGMIRQAAVDAPQGLLVLIPWSQVSVFSRNGWGRLYGGGSRGLEFLISVAHAHYPRRALLLP